MAADQDIVIDKVTDDDAQLLQIQSALKADPSTREHVLRMIQPPCLCPCKDQYECGCGGVATMHLSARYIDMNAS